MPNQNDATGYSWAEAESVREEQREAYRKTKAERLDLLSEAAVLVDVIGCNSRTWELKPEVVRMHEILDKLRDVILGET